MAKLQDVSVSETKTLQALLKVMMDRTPSRPLTEDDDSYLHLECTAKDTPFHVPVVRIARRSDEKSPQNIIPQWPVKVFTATYSPIGPYNLAGRTTYLSELVQKYFGPIGEVGIEISATIPEDKSLGREYYSAKWKAEVVLEGYTDKFVAEFFNKTPEYRAFSDMLAKRPKGIRESSEEHSVSSLLDELSDGNPIHSIVDEVRAYIQRTYAVDGQDEQVKKMMLQAYSMLQAGIPLMERQGEMYTTRLELQTNVNMEDKIIPRVTVAITECELNPLEWQDDKQIVNFNRRYGLWFLLESMDDFDRISGLEGDFMNGAEQISKKILGVSMLGRSYKARTSPYHD